MNLFLDFETASEVDLEGVGLDNYVRHASTRALLLSYAIDNGEIKLWEPHKNPRLPKDLAEAIINPECKKIAWNAPFEINVFKQVLKIDIPIEQWVDAQVQARYLSFPGGLDKVGKILGLPEELLKQAGTKLINMFCFPSHPGGEQTLFGISEPVFRDWNTNPREWEEFCQYCIGDTRTERELFNRMNSLPLPETERQVWLLDQKINNFGLPVNRQFADNAYTMCKEWRVGKDGKSGKMGYLKEKTELENPNSKPQMLDWAIKQGYPFNSMNKNFVNAALNSTANALTPLGREILKIQQETSKNSYTKLEKLHNFVSPDSRLRNQFLYYGAARTGRWSGTGVQVQNLTRPTKEVEKKYERALEIINAGDYKAAESEFSSVIGMTTSCIRSAFQASPGKKLVVCDYSAIENRVLGWLAGCETTLRVFLEGRDPYLDFASELYNIPYQDLKRRYDAGDKEAAFMRQMAKPAVLGAGYGLGGGEEKTNKWGDLFRTGLMGYAENLGIKMTQEEAHRSVEVFREKRPKIKELWNTLEEAAKSVLKVGGQTVVGPLVFDRKRMQNGQFILRTQLPSGRHLHYFNARLSTEIKVSKKGREYESVTILYDGIGHGVGATNDKQVWGPVKTYGGKFTENDVQAISRDILCSGLINTNNAGFSIFGHFHDEIGCEVDENSHLGIKELREAMIQPSQWGLDLPLDAAGWEGQVYKKG